MLKYSFFFLHSPSDSQQSYGCTPVSMPNFEHPSHELLKENGFVWHVYNKFHSKCLKGKLLDCFVLNYKVYKVDQMSYHTMKYIQYVFLWSYAIQLFKMTALQYCRTVFITVWKKLPNRINKVVKKKHQSENWILWNLLKHLTADWPTIMKCHNSLRIFFCLKKSYNCGFFFPK